jgi:hypothetical protein
VSAAGSASEATRRTVKDLTERIRRRGTLLVHLEGGRSENETRFSSGSALYEYLSAGKGLTREDLE